MATIPTPWDEPTEWTISADTTINASDVELNPDVGFQAGLCWWETAIDGTDTIDVSWDINIPDTGGADGTVFAIYDAADADRQGDLGSGGNLGFFGTGAGHPTGFCVAVFTFTLQDVQICSQAVTVGKTVLETMDVAEMRGTTTSFRCKISGGNLIEVWHGVLTGTADLSHSVTIPTNVHIGFTSATGGTSEQHIISAFSGTFAPSSPPPDPPTLLTVQGALSYG